MPDFQNSQRWSECQLVALWNAARMLGVDESLIPTPRQKRYRHIVADCGCLYGACVDVGPELERLGLKLVPGSWSIEWIKTHIPVEMTIFCHRGYHSVLVVDARTSLSAPLDNWELRLANYARGQLRWVGWNRIKKEMARKSNKPRAIERS